MPRPIIKTLIDCDVPDNKRRLVQQIGALSGLYEVDIRPRRNVRSLRQNRWYWSCVVSAFSQYLNDQDYEVTTAEMAHELLAARFLVVTVIDPRTEKFIGRRVRSTTELNTEEFSDYCERCRTWLADFFGIIVPDPGDYSIESGRERTGAKV